MLDLKLHGRMPTILVVDDTAANLQLLTGMLKEHGYKVRPALSGKLAMQAARLDPPDLILLDINMPEMNGYEVCRQLKATAALHEIPVIFISALTDTMDKIKALETGGVDYVTKPFQLQEVKARVETHLRLRQYQLELKDMNAHLEYRVQQKTRELAEAHHRLAVLDKAKSDFLHLICHELRSPLNGILGAAELLFGDMPTNAQVEEMLEVFKMSKQKLLGILEDALFLTQLDVSADAFDLRAHPLKEILGLAREMTSEFAESVGVPLGDVPRVEDDVMGEPKLLIKALSSLLKTACKFSKEGEPVRIGCQPEKDGVVILIQAQGHALPEEEILEFFKVFALKRTVVPGNDIGLAPPVAERIITLCGGSVTVSNEPPSGIAFRMKLKRGDT